MIDYKIWTDVYFRKLMDFAGHIMENNVLKLLLVIGALLAVLVTEAGCWTLCGCSMGGLSGSIWSESCHKHTQVSLSGSGLYIQKLLYASSKKIVLISPNRYSWPGIFCCATEQTALFYSLYTLNKNCPSSMSVALFQNLLSYLAVYWPHRQLFIKTSDR